MLRIFILDYLVLTAALLDYSLIKEFSRREKTNTMVLLYCNMSETIEAFRHLSKNFSGSIHALEQGGTQFINNHHLYMATQHFRLSVIADLSCPASVDLLDICSENWYFNGSYRWLLVSADTKDLTFKLMKNQNLNIDSRVTLAMASFESDADEAQYEIFEVYGTVKKRGGKTHVVNVGFWNSAVDHEWNCSTDSYRTRSNFGGIKLRSIVSVSSLYFFTVKKYRLHTFLQVLGAPHKITMDNYLSLTEPAKNYVANRLGYRTVKLLGVLLNFR